MQTEAIRQLTIRGRSEGLEQLTGALDRLSGAHHKVQQTSEGVAKTTETSARRLRSIEGAYDRLALKNNEVLRLQSRLEAEFRTVNAALDVGHISIEQYARDVQMLQGRLQDLGSTRLNVNVDQSGLNSLLGMREGTAGAAREAASVFEAELSRMEDIGRLKAQQVGAAFGADLDARLVAGVSKSARDAASVFEAELSRLDEIARMKAVEAGAAFSTGLNQGLGIGGGMKSARDSASVFDEAAREADQLATRVAALKSRLDPTAAAQDRLNAELAEFAMMADRGAINAQELASAQAMARAQFEQTTAAINQQNAATARGHGAFQTSNIAAQFQDIGVTAAMGQNPLTVALQQGTQLAAVLGPMGATGAARGLGAALASVLSPMSLLTIGAIALGVAGVQAFMGMGNQAEKSAEAMEAHDRWLDKILAGYKEARAAAENAATAANALPKEAVRSELQTDRTKQLADAAAQLAEIERILGLNEQHMENLRMAPAGTFDDFIEGYQQLDQVNLTLESTAEQFDAVQTQLTLIKNDAQVPEMIRAIAAEMLLAANEAERLRGNAAGAAAAVSNLAGLSLADWSALHGGLQGVSAAVEQIKNATPDLRSTREQMDAIFTQNIGEARTTSELNGLVAAYDKFTATMDEQDRQKAADEAAREAESRAKSAATAAQNSAEQQVDAYNRILDSADQRIRQQEIERQALGMTTEAANALRYANDMLNQAEQAGLLVTPQLTAELEARAAAMAASEAETAAATEAMNRHKEDMEFYKGAFSGFIGEVYGNVREGETIFDAIATAGESMFDRLTQRALDFAADGLFDMLLSGIAGGGAGLGTGQGRIGAATYGGSGGFFPGLTGPDIVTAGPFAFGGAGRVPGTGATDSKLFMARVTPGEAYAFGPHAMRGIGNDNQRTNVTVQIIDNVGVKRTTREVEDGRGGRRVEVQLDEMVASAASRPRSQTQKALMMAGQRPQR